MFCKLDDLDFADDIALLSSRLDHMQEKTNRLSRFAAQTGLSINEKKTQLLKINTTNQTPLKIQGKAINVVDDFTYLGSNVSKEDSISKDIKSRIAKARNAFIKLNPKKTEIVWLCS
ncbi:uncharacterized protein LOC144349239 [Saccoglossus kowalevskii]